MILINLLPHREAARKRRVELFNVSLGVAFLVGGLLAGLIFLWYQAQIMGQQEKNQILQSEINKFNVQIKAIAGLEAEISALRARQQAVEDLQADRNLPVHLLTQLVQQTPDGVYIATMSQENQSVTLQSGKQHTLVLQARVGGDRGWNCGADATRATTSGQLHDPCRSGARQ